MSSNQKTSELPAHIVRKRKMIIALPILVIPFITMAFWALGGGSNRKNVQQNMATGLNLQLPNAHLKDDSYENKLSFYEQADMDSVKAGNAIHDDLQLNRPNKFDTFSLKRNNITGGLNGDSRDANEMKVYQRLAAINQQLNEPDQHTTNLASNEAAATVNNAGDSKRLDRMLQTMNKANDNTSSDDDDLNRLDGMMDKIITIQHPQTLPEKNRSHNDSGTVLYTPYTHKISSNISLLDTGKTEQVSEEDQFFGVVNDSAENKPNAIAAVVHNEQMLTNGSIIKLRLSEDIFIKDAMIPKGTFVYGVTTLNDERLSVVINSIHYGQSLYPVSLTVYDADGLPGINIPGAVTRDAGKQSLDNTSQLLGMSSFDPSLKMQAASASIGAAKNLLSKKIRLVRVTIKAGYKLLLKENNNH